MVTSILPPPLKKKNTIFTTFKVITRFDSDIMRIMLLRFYFMCVFAYVCVLCTCLAPEDTVGSSENGVIDSCETVVRHMGTGN